MPEVKELGNSDPHAESQNSDIPDRNDHESCSACHQLQAKLDRTIGHMYYYREKLKKEETRVDAMEDECKKRISSVRSFWKREIYLEGSRPGKLLKMAMQK